MPFYLGPIMVFPRRPFSGAYWFRGKQHTHANPLFTLHISQREASRSPPPARAVFASAAAPSRGASHSPPPGSATAPADGRDASRSPPPVVLNRAQVAAAAAAAEPIATDPAVAAAALAGGMDPARWVGQRVRLVNLARAAELNGFCTSTDMPTCTVVVMQCFHPLSSHVACTNHVVHFHSRDRL
jgi:hypothetical protein